MTVFTTGTILVGVSPAGPLFLDLSRGRNSSRSGDPRFTPGRGHLSLRCRVSSGQARGIAP